MSVGTIESNIPGRLECELFHALLRWYQEILLATQKELLDQILKNIQLNWELNQFELGIFYFISQIKVCVKY